MISPSGKWINGKWIPTNPPQIDPPPSQTQNGGRDSHVSKPPQLNPAPPPITEKIYYDSKTKKTGLKEAIKAAFDAGNTTLEKIRAEILKKGFDLGIESIRKIMIELNIGKRYQKRVEKKVIGRGTCKPKDGGENKL